MSEVVNESNAVETVVPEGSADVAISTDNSPSHDDLKSQGWSQSEIQMAEKQGRIKKQPKEDKPEVKTDATPEPETEAQEVKPEEKKAAATEKRSPLPEFSLTPEEEAKFNEFFKVGSSPRGLYHRMKSERALRQAAESKARELDARLRDLEQKSSQPASSQEVDENGNTVDPEDKPLTVKQWRELQAQEAEQRQKQQEQIRNQGNAVAQSLKSQEEYAKDSLPNYDETLKLAADVMQNLDGMFETNWEKQEAVRLIQDLQVAAANADQFGIDDRNAAWISYQIGKLHPNYGKSQITANVPTPTGNLDPKKANGSLTPEQMKRLEKNTQRGVSSASIPGGGGKRTISVEDIGLSEYNKMSLAERVEFKTKHPKRHAEILRG